MRYLFQKSPIPIIWLDTSIIIKFTKMRIGRGLNHSDAERLTKLNKVILEKVQDQKLICPIARQREEYERKDIVEECFRTQEHLARGVQFLPALQIQHLQRHQALEAFVQK